ncbi:hypothetical protein C8P66_108140 [Humitalea rosea]|uniref:Uncharacterized protein n=1 Tax=Humitalea rosea TaxID=990373 RepID=A0A2W7IM74_9PROT|nr:hypothetical protein [Humitalea rosea]PZW46861.1 hypothetical protein C8P66_108140 [Humitalea rosea]
MTACKDCGFAAALIAAPSDGYAMLVPLCLRNCRGTTDNGIAMPPPPRAWGQAPRRAIGWWRWVRGVALVLLLCAGLVSWLALAEIVWGDA